MYETNSIDIKVGTKVYLPDSRTKGTVTDIDDNGREATVLTEDGETVKEKISRLSFVPRVGMPVAFGAFITYPGTVVKVNAKETTMLVRPDNYEVAGGEWPDVYYSFSHNYEAVPIEFRLNNKGQWKRVGDGYSSACIGRRVYYSNPSF